ncbi:hypothetical protein MCEMIH22_01706 [Candidatus Methylacidiphilaceae bacterium]
MKSHDKATIRWIRGSQAIKTVFPLAIIAWLTFGQRLCAQSLAGGETNEPARLCIALGQPGENETVAWNQGKPMWKRPAYPGYAMGEYTLPAGPLTLELRHPSRPVSVINEKLVGGKCYLLVVDQKTNPDPKTKEQYPVVTDARWVQLPWGKPSGQSAIFAYGAGPNPITLRPNDKTINLSPGQVTKISDGYALLSDSAGNPLMDFNPSGDTYFLLVIFSGSSGKLAPVRCNYY